MPQTSDVTIMFTDVVGSTELIDRLGDEHAADVLHRHFADLQAAARRHGGRVVKNLGDGLMLVFGDPRAAAACAAAMQRAVVWHNLRNGEAIGLRIGVHTGPVQQRSGDYFGRHVVIAKRLCDSCRGGEVLVSDVVRAYLADHVLPCTDRGPAALRGFAERVETASLHWQLAAIDTDTTRAGRFPLTRIRLAGRVAAGSRVPVPA